MNPGDLIQIWRHRHCIGIFLGKEPGGDSLVIWYPSEYTIKSDIAAKVNKVNSQYLVEECIVILNSENK